MESTGAMGRDESIHAVIFDWAGTLVDDGSVAPVLAIRAVFETHGVILTDAAIRESMGLRKRDHLAELLRRPEVEEAWTRHEGAAPTESDPDHLNHELEAKLPDVVVARSRPLSGVIAVLDHLRKRGIALGSTTGYTRPTMNLVVPEARRRGVVLDHVVTSDEVPTGRPAPWMIFRNLEALGTFPPHRVVKVGDTPQDMREGRNAGAWAVGVLEGGNEPGLPTDELQALAADDRAARLLAARQALSAAGAHEVLTSMSELPDAIRKFEARNREIFGRA